MTHPHTAIFSGDGHYCSTCNVSWDQGEDPPTRCVPPWPDASFTNGGPPGLILVAFTGGKGSGKDTAAAVFVREGFVHLKMADGLKAMLRALLTLRGVDEETATRMLEGDLKETPTPALNGRSMRHAMQTLGTEWGRKIMDTDFWVSVVEDMCRQHTRVVISDVRFPNEAAMVRRLGGHLCRVTRPATGDGETDQHASETQILGLRVDSVVSNEAPSAAAFQQQIEQSSVARFACLTRL